MYILIEVRDENGKLDSVKEEIKKKEHPFLFSKKDFTITELLHYASYEQGRNKQIGPSQLPAFFKSIGVSYREKYWQ